ncbi:MAG: carbamoyl-phosphate synthase large subunit [Methanosphaera sp.]|jgi:carbamoyl-phosphate synthase large subunit|uniref:carbamoyl-phosphate synthase large subunit n=1 Tax=Methanosphaera TaxID=2316 RepID=UPI002380346B|nr:carbamoyl-phosphate synthase large subunit [Candidatus Methanosphaera massiliense]MDD6286246.1 carbamoyl-phosphate synthase large subunit [Methanobacteriaceae archaeon]MDE4077589.1 carbamoyl-phosphate synthase large subunit [Candidatus Methanosphaera massiliense]MDY2744431.1 carbamoyl-phosphate synthase large subunit [Methanosphaera sp.]
MPKDKDIKKVLIIGSGPIQIGQAAEFDYSGSQACKSLREENVETVLVNSNPATIQTDIDSADRVYVEPLTAEVVAKIIEKEQVDAILPTMGGQTGLNIAIDLEKMGALEGVRVLGSPIETINNVEDRDLFAEFMEKLNEPIPKCHAVNSLEEAYKAVEDIGYPAIVRPAFTLGGTGGGIAHNKKEFEEIVNHGLEMSFINQVLIDESVLGWEEFEYEVMRDKNDSCIIVCNMENIDPMGIHTGESIVVAPTQTLSDEDNQRLRDASIKIIRALGICGGCNIQFAVHPITKEYKVIEVNPRVSRSSALASKATGYSIAKVSSKIALGMTLDEISNDITKETPASFEPAIDYVIAKIPRWPFDKFKGNTGELGVQMQSTGEVMAIGRTIEEALQKAIRSLDIDQEAFEYTEYTDYDLEHATDQRIFQLYSALKDGRSIDELAKITNISPFFIHKIKNIVDMEERIEMQGSSVLYNTKLFREIKQYGFSDKRIGELIGLDEDSVTNARLELNLQPEYKMVDTCAAEFEAKTPYYYGTYDSAPEIIKDDKKKIVVLGAGPIRIGQGIEFDYCCVHAALALKDENVETILINNNPETVSTDYDISDRLYFEPLTKEDVLAVLNQEQPDGVIVQFGGQTSINLAEAISKAGYNIIGTPFESIDMVEDREQFTEVLNELKIPQADYGIANSLDDAREAAHSIGFPVLVRPSYVLGGRAMEIVYDDDELEDYMKEAVKVSKEHPILIDKFLEDSIELDVDALADGENVYVCGIMEHIEEAGIHSGDSACVIPPQTIPEKIIEQVEDYTTKLALKLGVIGLINIQYAIKMDPEPKLYIIEANPRASRTVPFVSKSIGIPIAKIASKLMLGAKLTDFDLVNYSDIKHVSVKESVFPFLKIPDADTVLGPEMKSTGESMGIDKNFGLAYYKAQLAANMKLPTEGKFFLSVRDSDKPKIAPIAKKAKELGFDLIATRGTANAAPDVDIDIIRKVSQGSPNIRDAMFNGEVAFVVNTPSGKQSADDGYIIRRLAIELGIPYVTTIAGANAVLKAIEEAGSGDLNVKSLNEYGEL